MKQYQSNVEAIDKKQIFLTNRYLIECMTVSYLRDNADILIPTPIPETVITYFLINLNASKERGSDT